ncbi:MAG: nucleotide exchange factor GrpE [Lachnospiraceae bacterium]|nr:nucleotide exchange factor GrpE [Lachnospiraceae bacterium]
METNENKSPEDVFETVLKDLEEKEKAKAEAEAAAKAEEKEEPEVIIEPEVSEDAKKAAEYLDKYQRTLAEFDNFRKRTSREKASMYDDGVRDTVEKLLPTIDNLERAIASSKDVEDPLYKGIEMVLKQLKETFKAMGVEEIPDVGKKFDPNVHAAVSHIEDENYGENEVTMVMLKGYKYKDKVIRPSMVQVAN